MSGTGILDIIKPIRLLEGSHSDTAKTGSGCFMNVIAYLNGEPQITDQSPCVCRTIKNIAIWINDFLADGERGALLPFVQRAMGTATDDQVLIRLRLDALAELVDDLAEMTIRISGSDIYAERATGMKTLAFIARSMSAQYVDSVDCMVDLGVQACGNAKYAARNPGDRTALVDRLIGFMDAVCPPADAPSRVLIERANRLMALVEA